MYINFAPPCSFSEIALTLEDRTTIHHSGRLMSKHWENYVCQHQIPLLDFCFRDSQPNIDNCKQQPLGSIEETSCRYKVKPLRRQSDCSCNRDCISSTGLLCAVVIDANLCNCRCIPALKAKISHRSTQATLARLVQIGTQSMRRWPLCLAWLPTLSAFFVYPTFVLTKKCNGTQRFFFGCDCVMVEGGIPHGRNKCAVSIWCHTNRH